MIETESRANVRRAAPAPDDEPGQTVLAQCRECRKPLTFRVEADALWMFRLEKWVDVICCNECADKLESIRKAKIEAAAAIARTSAQNKQWSSLCPVEFRKTMDWSKPGAKRDRYEAVMAWEFGQRGLFAFGPTRRCKTRFVWVMLRREFESGRRIVADTHAAWRMTISRLASGDATQAHGFIQSCAKADILFIDDLGKGRGTPAAEEAFFMVLDSRARNGLPCIFTSNDSYAELQARFSAEYGEPIVARIEDYCERIDFGGR